MTQTLWDMLSTYYPFGMRIFVDWIKQYSKENNLPMQYLILPEACQIGIWIEFCKEYIDLEDGWEVDLMYYDWEGDMINTIRSLNVEHHETDED